MLGHITEWFYKDLCGIECDPDGPGFKKIIIRPDPVGDLTWARARYDSVRGLIETEWRREDGTFRLRVTLPPNTRGTVWLPALEAGGVTESGRPAGESPGVEFLRMEGDRAVFAVQSGTYEFQSRF
jgi:hypothetical protein